MTTKIAHTAAEPEVLMWSLGGELLRCSATVARLEEGTADELNLLHRIATRLSATLTPTQPHYYFEVSEQRGLVLVASINLEGSIETAARQLESLARTVEMWRQCDFAGLVKKWGKRLGLPNSKAAFR